MSQEYKSLSDEYDLLKRSFDSMTFRLNEGKYVFLKSIDLNFQLFHLKIFFSQLIQVNDEKVENETRMNNELEAALELIEKQNSLSLSFETKVIY